MGYRLQSHSHFVLAIVMNLLVTASKFKSIKTLLKLFKTLQECKYNTLHCNTTKFYYKLIFTILWWKKTLENSVFSRQKKFAYIANIAIIALWWMIWHIALCTTPTHKMYYSRISWVMFNKMFRLLFLVIFIVLHM